ncbi:hypothetical protein [Sphingomonas endophytica]|uniref:Uncharacterized protein n=1 Tax=Sphingomonas endophytica TaxID=869719 RepID=A0A147HZ90_9SPHN|nr:hypothetical protein [Sphingomonas endophytica]KTT70316.1 hypothetical protein NS334_12690 [Sphingomonas endophytica]
MWKELARLNEELVVAMQNHRDVCDGAIVDLPTIASLRWRIAGISRQRLDHLNNTVLPTAEATATGEFARRLQALKESTPAYRQQISAFLAAWPTAAIPGDWAGYRSESLAILAVIQRRLADENVLMQLAARRGSHAGDAREAVASLRAELWR